MEADVEQLVLKNIFYNEEYFRRVFPYIKEEYFDTDHTKLIFEIIKENVAKFNTVPKPKEIAIDMESRKLLRKDIYVNSMASLGNIVKERKEDNTFDWLIDTTERWCQDRSLYLAIQESILIAEEQVKGISTSAIPSILTEALSITFDPNIGHDYLEDSELRYKSYHEKLRKIPFKLDIFNKVTEGGLPPKTVSIVIAETGGGKSIFMVDHAAHCLTEDKNVLYITMELSEEEVGKRIDANLMKVPMGDFKNLNLKMFNQKMDKVKSLTKAKLIVKEYPTGAAHTGHFRSLLNELKLKKKFIPDIIMIDYINICTSERMGKGENSYGSIKKIVEDFRGLAVEFNVPVLTATQFNRGGYENSEPGLKDTAESMGTTHTADFIFVLVATEELTKLNQVMIKQLKNRFNDLSYYKRFIVGLDKARMTFYNVEDSVQKKYIEDGVTANDEPVFDNTDAGEGMNSGRNKDYSKYSLKYET
jgi:replicative DNA helicase